MKRLLFTVADSFEITGRGLVIIPGIIPRDDERFRVGDAIELRRPDGTVFHARIAGLELLNPTPPDHSIPVLMPLGISKQDAPLGTEVWSVG
jgi:hypothetical protein